MMICKRCGTRCPVRESGFCFHCQIATEMEKALSDKAGRPVKLSEFVEEGFPEWEKPKKDDKYIEEMLL